MLICERFAANAASANAASANAASANVASATASAPQVSQEPAPYCELGLIVL